MTKLSRIFLLLATLFLVACASIPTGPSIMALPGSGKNFEQFRHDDQLCRQYAYSQVGGKLPGQAVTASGVEIAAVGAGLGAISGTAIGGGEGAAIGAGIGLLAGGLAGTESASASGFIAQQRYDMHYIQCMYAQGHRVPVAGTIMQNPAADRGNTNILRYQSEFIPPPPPPPSGNPPSPPPQ